MRFILLLLSIFLLCNTSSSVRLGNNKPHKTKFSDLYDDVLVLILNHVEFEDLLNLVKVDKHFGNLVREAFRTNYHDYEVQLLNTLEGVHFQEKLRVDDTKKIIEIFDYPLILNIFDNFIGGLRRLKIDNRKLGSEFTTIINELANQRGHGSITHLNLGDVKENTFEQFTIPFENVEELTCYLLKNQTGNNILPFNELFPNLRRLTTHVASEYDYSYLDCELPHLESLFILILGGHNSDLQSQIEGFLQKNQQLTELDLTNHPPNIKTKFIYNLLPNLEKVTIHDFKGDGIIHFPHVKDAYVVVPSEPFIWRLSFPELESIKSHYTSMQFNAWVDFFRRHPNITKLELEETMSFEYFRLDELTLPLADLVEVNMQIRAYVTPEAVIHFIRNHHRLEKFTISLLDHGDMRELEQLFKDDWHIRKFDPIFPGLIFEKKNSTILM